MRNGNGYGSLRGMLMKHASEEDWDPWQSNIYGIPTYSPEEWEIINRAERKLIEAHGYGWSADIPTRESGPYDAFMKELARVSAAEWQKQILEIILEGK